MDAEVSASPPGVSTMHRYIPAHVGSTLAMTSLAMQPSNMCSYSSDGSSCSESRNHRMEASSPSATVHSNVVDCPATTVRSVSGAMTRGGGPVTSCSQGESDPSLSLSELVTMTTSQSLRCDDWGALCL